MSFLNPTKRKTIGTALLLVANWFGSYLSRLLSQFFNPRFNTANTNGSDAVVIGGRNFGGRMQFGNGGSFLVSQSINLVILAVLFYIAISFIMEKLIIDSSSSAIAVSNPKQTKTGTDKN